MLTKNQQAWLNVTIKRIDAMIAAIFPPRDYEWKAITHMVSELVDVNARGNPEVRQQLIRLLSKWELKSQKLKEERK